MSWRCQQTQVTWYHAITVWSILSLLMAWQYVEWYSLDNTVPVYGLVKSILTQFGWYHACLWPGEVNVDIAWLIPCLFMAWWSQYWHSLVDTMPAYCLVKSILTEFGWYHAGLGLGKVNTDTAWLIWCLFMGWWSQPTQFSWYQASLCSDDVNWQSLVNTMPVYVLAMSTDRVQSITFLVMF